MEPLLPPPRALVEENRRQQQYYVRTAEIQRNLRETEAVALRVLTALADRGYDLDVQEQHAEDITASSQAVLDQVREAREARTWYGWLKRCCCCCAAVRAAPQLAAKKKERQTVFRFSRYAADDE